MNVSSQGNGGRGVSVVSELSGSRLLPAVEAVGALVASSDDDEPGDASVVGLVPCVVSAPVSVDPGAEQLASAALRHQSSRRMPSCYRNGSEKRGSSMITSSVRVSRNATMAAFSGLVSPRFCGCPPGIKRGSVVGPACTPLS